MNNTPIYTTDNQFFFPEGTCGILREIDNYFPSYLKKTVDWSGYPILKLQLIPKTSIDSGISYMHCDNMSHSMWIATLGGWIERVLLSMDGDNDSVIQYVYDNLDPVIKAQGLDIDIGELGNIKTSDFRKLLCDSRRNLQDYLFVDLIRKIQDKITGHIQRTSTPCTVYPCLMKTSLYQDQNSPIREADKLLFSRNNEFSAFDWTITQLPTSPTISQHNFIPQHIIDTFNNSKGNVGYDHLLDLTNSDNISLVQKYLYDYLYLGAREAEEVYISYRDQYSQKYNFWNDMPYSLIQAADQGNGILFSQLMTFGRYSLNIQPPEEIRLLSSYDDTVHVSENIAPRFQTNIYAEANNALVNSMGIGVFIPDYTIEHSVGTIQYEFSHSVYVDEDGNIVETMTPDYPPEIDWQKHREDKKLDYGFYEGYETYDETSFAGHYDISKVLFQGTIPPNPIETRLLGQTGAAQWQGGKAIINGIEIQANDFPELAPGGQYANEDVYLNIYSVADIFAGNCDGVSPWTGDVYDHGEDSRIMASPMDTECYNRWTLSSTWTFYGKEDPRCIISCGDPQYPSKLAWENDYVLSNALYGYSPIKGEKTAGEEANTKYSTVDMIPAKNYNSSLEALSAIMNDEDGELHIVDRCTELVQQMEGDFQEERLTDADDIRDFIEDVANMPHPNFAQMIRNEINNMNGYTPKNNMWLGIFWCQRGPVIIPINSTYMYKFYVDIDYQCLTMGDYEGIATKEIPASEIIGQEEPPTQYPSYQYHFEHKVPLVSFDWNWKSINDRKQ